VLAIHQLRIHSTALQGCSEAKVNYSDDDGHDNNNNNNDNAMIMRCIITTELVFLFGLLYGSDG